jgi:enoyl-[acyl-carrier protein] reductase / trans-2-enoyl-CoA reductase (NAD+)
MIIKPMIRNNICMNAHPRGLAVETQRQIDYVTSQEKLNGPQRVLVIGGSAGYGLASRIVAAYSCGAATLNVAFERPASGKRTATVGWYNTEYFEERAKEDGKEVATVYGDAFSDEVKDQVVRLIKESWGSVDLIVYSLASPMRTDPRTGESYRSVLKPIGDAFTARTVDMMSGEFRTVTVEPATDEEIQATVKVMGGEDWELWIDRLLEEGLLAQGVKTVAYSYIGPDLISRVYREGSIGKAKEHLEATAKGLTAKLAGTAGSAFVSVNKAVVTRASSVIPVVPLYGVILFRVMKEMGVHEGTIEQIYRLFAERLYAPENGSSRAIPVDEEGRIRVDDWEMRDDVQQRVKQIFDTVDEHSLREVTDIDSYYGEFLRIHGFGVESVNYDEEIEP